MMRQLYHADLREGLRDLDLDQLPRESSEKLDGSNDTTAD